MKNNNDGNIAYFFQICMFSLYKVKKNKKVNFKKNLI